MRSILAFACLLATAGPSYAADPAASLSPSERREQLAKVSEDLNSADPLRRMTTLDAVLHGNDPLAREVAIETALGSADPTMRNYAARLLLANTSILDLRLTLPPDVQTAIAKVGDDADAKQKVVDANRYVFQLMSGDQITYQISKFDPDTGKFAASCQGQAKDDPAFVGQLSGGSLQMRGHCYVSNRMNSDCAASLDLGPQGVFTGTFSCTGFPRAVPASVRLH